MAPTLSDICHEIVYDAFEVGDMICSPEFYTSILEKNKPYKLIDKKKGHFIIAINYNYRLKNVSYWPIFFKAAE